MSSAWFLSRLQEEFSNKGKFLNYLEDSIIWVEISYRPINQADSEAIALKIFAEDLQSRGLSLVQVTPVLMKDWPQHGAGVRVVHRSHSAEELLNITEGSHLLKILERYALKYEIIS